MKISGSVASILTGERIALNFYQRLSDIATETKQLVDLISPYQRKLLDTRKTTPGLRPLENMRSEQVGDSIAVLESIMP